MKTVAIIGAGRVGGAIGFLLAQAGYGVVAVANRTRRSADEAVVFIGAGEPLTDAAKAASRAEIVFITTPDGAIKTTCDAVAAAGGFRQGAIVIHASGGHTLDLLDAARTAGALRAVVHPLQSVPDREQGVRNLPGSFFRIEADTGARETVQAVVAALGGSELAMPKWTPDRESAALYHAGAVAVSNYLVALIDYGLAFYQTLGADKQQALRAVLPLIKGTLANMERLGTTEALTGPIVRGDVETVQAHMEAMKKRAPELLPLYRSLAQKTIALARERGCPEETVQQLEKVVNL